MELQENLEHVDDVQSNQKDEDYKNLQAFATRNRQTAIELAMKLADVNPKTILEIGDKELQKKVIQNKYWLNSVDELTLIYWNDLSEERSNNGGDNSNDEIKQLRQNILKIETDKEIEKYILKNNLDESAFERIKEELSYFSHTISIKDRVEKAAKIIMWAGSPYKALIEEQPSMAPSIPLSAEKKKDNIDVSFADAALQRIKKKF